VKVLWDLNKFCLYVVPDVPETVLLTAPAANGRDKQLAKTII
jgi:hypothetical protein